MLAVYAPLDADPTPDAFFMARSEDRLHGVTFVRDRLGEEGARNGRVYEVRAVVLVTRLEVCELAGLITIFGGPDTQRHEFSATFILPMKSASSVTHLHRAQLFAASPLSLPQEAHFPSVIFSSALILVVCRRTLAMPFCIEISMISSGLFGVMCLYRVLLEFIMTVVRGDRYEASLSRWLWIIGLLNRAAQFRSVVGSVVG